MCVGVSGVDLLGPGGATSFKREGGRERERMMEKAIGQVNGFNIGLGCLFFGLGVRQQLLDSGATGRARNDEQTTLSLWGACVRTDHGALRTAITYAEQCGVTGQSHTHQASHTRRSNQCLGRGGIRPWYAATAPQQNPTSNRMLKFLVR